MSKSKKQIPPVAEKFTPEQVIPKPVEEKARPVQLKNLQLLVFIIYSALILFGVLHHESWADEAQSWLIARDNNLSGILRLLPSEGHPPLWYLLLYPVTHLGLPYESIKWLTAIIAIAAVYLLLFRTNIPILLKLFLPFSYVFFFEYALFGRSYCLILFFIAAIISLYPKRYEKPWLFAMVIIGLYNTHMLVFTFAFGLMLLFLADAIQQKKANSKVLLPFAMMCMGGLYLVPYLTTDKMASHFGRFITDHAEKITSAISGGILVDGNKELSIILFLVSIILLAQRTKPLFLALCGIGGVLYILGYRYGGTTRHFAVLFVILFSSYAIASFYKEDSLNIMKKIKPDLTKTGTWLICCIILLQLPYSFGQYKRDMDDIYSDAKNTAEYLSANTTKQNVIIAWPASNTLGILPYMPGTKFYYAECERYGTHYIYDSCFRSEQWMNPVDYAVKVAHDNFKDSLDNIVFVFNYFIMPQTEKYLDLVYKTPEETVRWDETFYIYKFKENVK